jgi:hypothetical protein
MIGDVALLDPDRAQQRVAQPAPIEPLPHRRDREIAGAPVRHRMKGGLEVAGNAKELAPTPKLLVAIGLALPGTLAQRQASRHRPHFQEIHRLVVDGQAEAAAELLEPQVSEISPRRGHGIVIVDGLCAHDATPAADDTPR